jgi:hypothetical protein
MNEPVGSLCVLADEDHKQWTVSICQGGGNKLVLRRFDSQDQAADFAIEERARRQQLNDGPMTIHFPDDCPCCGKGRSW